MKEFSMELTAENVLGLAEALAAILIFSIAIGWWPLDFSKHLRFFTKFVDRNCREEMGKSKQIGTQIHEIKTNMSVLSPTADFAKYFKQERVLRKLEDERAKIEKSLATRSLIGSIKLNASFKFLFLCGALFMAWHSDGGGFICTKIQPKWLFPLNFFLPLPILNGILSIFSNQESQDLHPTGDFALTFFDFTLMAIFVKKIYKFRRQTHFVNKID